MIVAFKLAQAGRFAAFSPNSILELVLWSTRIYLHKPISLKIRFNHSHVLIYHVAPAFAFVRKSISFDISGLLEKADILAFSSNTHN